MSTEDKKDNRVRNRVIAGLGVAGVAGGGYALYARGKKPKDVEVAKSTDTAKPWKVSDPEAAKPAPVAPKRELRAGDVVKSEGDAFLKQARADKRIKTKESAKAAAKKGVRDIDATHSAPRTIPSTRPVTTYSIHESHILPDLKGKKLADKIANQLPLAAEHDQITNRIAALTARVDAGDERAAKQLSNFLNGKGMLRRASDSINKVRAKVDKRILNSDGYKVIHEINNRRMAQIEAAYASLGSHSESNLDTPRTTNRRARYKDAAHRPVSAITQTATTGSEGKIAGKLMSTIRQHDKPMSSNRRAISAIGPEAAKGVSAQNRMIRSYYISETANPTRKLAEAASARGALTPAEHSKAMYARSIAEVEARAAAKRGGHGGTIAKGVASIKNMAGKLFTNKLKHIK